MTCSAVEIRAFEGSLFFFEVSHLENWDFGSVNVLRQKLTVIKKTVENFLIHGGLLANIQRAKSFSCFRHRFPIHKENSCSEI